MPIDTIIIGALLIALFGYGMTYGISSGLIKEVIDMARGE